MSESQSAPLAPASADAPTERPLLDRVIAATRQTPPDLAKDLVKTLVEQAMDGTVTFQRNFTRTVARAVAILDGRISAQLNEIMHDEKFLKLEGSWRGLHFLVNKTETGPALKIRVLNVSKDALTDNFDRDDDPQRSQLWRAVYENEFATPGGEPFGALIGDYEWSNDTNDVSTLRAISAVAAGAFAPFISAAAPGLLGLESWTELAARNTLASSFESSDYAQWRSFRESEDARFVSLVMPRVLARLPYGPKARRAHEFDYNEQQGVVGAEAGEPGELPHDHYCWMNAAYAMGTRLTDAFARYGFCTRIRGAEGGGKVENLPLHTVTTADGDRDNKCPTEINISDPTELELSRLGLLPLVHYKNTDYAAFLGAQTVQRPRKYDSPDATANAEISARLPYMMATSRFAHYLKCMGRDKVGRFQDAPGLQRELHNWISKYVNTNADAGEELKAQRPLREARVEVKEQEGHPGVFNAIAYLRPWLQMEELTASLRMVARIPKAG